MNACLSELKAYNVLGHTVHAVELADLQRIVRQAITDDQKLVVANHNLHSIYLCQVDPTMPAFYAKADVVHADGMSIIVLGRLLGLPLRRAHRTTYADWVDPLLAQAAELGMRVFFVGSKPGVGEAAARSLRTKYPALQIAVAHGYFQAETGHPDNEAILQQINAFCPNILMVGMGMPRQERWIAANRDRVHTNIVLPCGACMDYVAGKVPTPPRWMGRVGLEWLFRLITDPKRLWQRYLIEPWAVLGLLCRHYWR